MSTNRRRIANPFDNASPGRAIGVGVLLLIGFITLVVWAAGATYRAVPVDKIALHYTGGPVQGTHFVSVVSPGSHTKYYGQFEHMYLLPATQRTYIISANPKHGDLKEVDTVAAPSKDNVLMNFEGVAYFKLNVARNVIRQFFEQICLHDDCTDLSDGGGWDQMLAQYFRPQIETALRQEAGKYNYADMWHDPTIRSNIQSAVASVLKDDINTHVGGEYFCGPDSTASKCTPLQFVLQAATPPQAVVDQYTQTAAAQQAVLTAEQQAAAKRAAAQGDADAQALRAGAPPVPAAATAYIKAQAEAACAANPNCKLVIVDGSNSTVQVSSG
jgi:regulator of protease activity HflC (stomatin/prohibitin superfamily)